MKKLLGIVGMLVIGSHLGAQTLDDVELFNSSSLHGSPRFVAMGGAFTALGNDMSSIRINPAGASVYRTDQIAISFGLINRFGDQSNFFNSTSSMAETDIILENVGVVKNWTTGGYKDETKFTFSVGYNKIAQFDRNYTISGKNQLGPFGRGSLADYWYKRVYPDGFEDGAFGLTGDQLEEFGYFEELAAFDAFVLVTDDNGAVQDIALGNNSDMLSDIVYSRNENGSLGETYLTLGGAYEDKLYYGIGLGFPNLAYNLTEVIEESNLPPDTLPFDMTSYNLQRYNDIYANGFNFKLGLIYRPVHNLRFGASYQSPSWYKVNQIYEVTVNSSFANGSTGQGWISTGEYRYALRTPSIYRLGAAVILGKKGLISVDYEYVNPSSSHLYNSESTFGVSDEHLEFENQAIADVLKGRSTIRVGGEYRIGSIFLRAGYSYRQSEYREPDFFRSSTNIYTAGIGYEADKFGVHLAYSRGNYTRQDFVHEFNDKDGNVREELSTTDVVNSNILLGVNFRF